MQLSLNACHHCYKYLFETMGKAEEEKSLNITKLEIFIKARKVEVEELIDFAVKDNLRDKLIDICEKLNI